MRTAEQVQEELDMMPYIGQIPEQVELLRNWGIEIIEQCAKYMMESLPGDDSEIVRELKDQL